MEDSDPMPPFKHFLIAISLGCLSYFLPVISVSVAALGELISFYWSKDNDSKPEPGMGHVVTEPVTIPTVIRQETRPVAAEPVTEPVTISTVTRHEVEPATEPVELKWEELKHGDVISENSNELSSEDVSGKEWGSTRDVLPHIPPKGRFEMRLGKGNGEENQTYHELPEIKALSDGSDEEGSESGSGWKSV